MVNRPFKSISVKTVAISGRPHYAIDDDATYKTEASILADQRITIWQQVLEVKISVGSVEKIIHDH